MRQSYLLATLLVLAIFSRIETRHTWSPNLIFNGNFENNPCDLNNFWCTYFQSNYKNQIPGWMPSPQIQVVQSTYVNRPAWEKVGQSWVIELDADGNSCIKQTVTGLFYGRYVLKLDWAPMLGYDLQTSGFELKIAGKLSRHFQSKNYDINKEIIEFFLDFDVNNSQIEFCGTGTSDNVGVSVDNVQLYRLNQY